MKLSRIASRESIRIFELNGQLVAIVVGSKPESCQGPSLIKTRPGCFDLRCKCPDKCEGQPMAGKYFVVQPLEAGLPADKIKVRHAGGTESIAVRPMDPAAEKANGDSALLGISQDFSLEAAFKDALGKMDPKNPKPPGLMEVVSMGALYGGFSGFSRLFVRVASTPDFAVLARGKR
jgi:hypothetical protein